MKTLLLSLILLTPCAAQTPSFYFSYRIPNSDTSVPLLPNGTITLPTVAIGSTSTILLTITNQSNTVWRVLDSAIQGDQFNSTVSPQLLNPGAAYAFPVTFSPTTAGTAFAIFTVRFMSSTGFASQSSFPLTANASSTTGNTGTSPGDTSSVIISYVFPDRGNSIPLAPGESIPYPVTTAGTRQSATVVITNRGSTSTTIQSAAVTGAGFEMTSLPLLPAPMIAGGEMRFNIVFAPTDGSNYTGELRITVLNQTRSYRLTGQGAAGQISYELTSAGVTSRIGSGSTIVFPSLSAGTGSTMVTLRIKNTGNGESRLGGLMLSGGAFSLLDQPPSPIALRANEELAIRIQFTPNDVTEYTGQLRIDTASFPLSGRGTGARLSAYLMIGDDRYLLRSTGRGVIPNTSVGGRTLFTVEVTNTGDEPAPIAAVQLSGEGFSVVHQPPLPARIAPGQSMLIGGSFAPSLVGSVIGFLVVQELSFQLLGVGNDPPPLPAVRFLGLPETPQALQQPPLALELETSYPYDLTGSLRLTFSNDNYVDDPAIQFLNGLRTIDFRIPANTRRAIFGTSAQEIRLQTGSLAGTITIVAQINTGKFDLTRGTPPVAVMNLPVAAPVIRTVEFVARASKSFELVITGAVTSRTLSRFTFKFTPKTGAKLQTTTLTADVSRNFETWFQSANSRPYGGQFRASLVFDLTADFGAIESIEVAAVNSLGTSASKLVKIAAEK